MKQRIYFPGIAIILVVMTSFTACNKDQMTDSVQTASNAPAIPNRESTLLHINHWFMNQDDTYLAHFERFLESNGQVKKVSNIYLSNLSGQDVQQLGEVPTKCSGGKIWYKANGMNLDVFFIPDDGKTPPIQLILVIYFNS